MAVAAQLYYVCHLLVYGLLWSFDKDTVAPLSTENRWNNFILVRDKGKFERMRLHVSTAVSMKVTAFWDVAPCSLVKVVVYGPTRRYTPGSCHLRTRRRKNMKPHTVNFYGEATLRFVRRFESLRIKYAKGLCSLQFLLRCRDKDMSTSMRLHGATSRMCHLKIWT
jgi:hypothetical protein